MKLEADFIEKMIDKYGSRKALIVLAGMAGIYFLPIPEMLDPDKVVWVLIAQVAGMTILGVMGLVLQWKLDKGEPPIE